METATSLFSDEFRQRLAQGKYTKWAANLTEAHLGGLLWMVGEAAYRWGGLSTRLQLDSEWRVSGRYDRAQIALTSILRIVLEAERFDIEEARARIRHGRGYPQFYDLPEIVQSAANTSTPGAEWSSIVQSVDGFELEGVDEKGRTIRLSINAVGEVLENPPIREGREVYPPLAGRKTIASLFEKPCFEGPLQIDLVEEHKDNSIRFFLACRKLPPLTPADIIFFTTPLPPEAHILKSAIEWERDVPEDEAREIHKLLAGARPPLAGEDGKGWLDGTGFGFRMARGSFDVQIH